MFSDFYGYRVRRYVKGIARDLRTTNSLLSKAITKLRNSMFTEPSEAYYMRALSEEKSALVAQPGRAKVS